MDIKSVQERSKQLLEIKRTALDRGILNADWYGIHLITKTFFKLASSENLKLSVTDREDTRYPFQASFIYEDTTYFTVLSEEEYQQHIEILGGKDNESITKA